MTICIAAGCRDDGGRPMIVFCADTKGSSPLGSTNVMQKVLPLTDHWMLGVAGDEDEINAMFRVARFGFLNAIDQGITIDDYNAELLFRAALAKRSKDKKDEMAQAEFAMSYDQLLQVGGRQLPQDHYSDFISKTRAIQFRGRFLVAGVSYGAPFMIVSDHAGNTSLHGGFVALGSGSYLAESMLLLREHSDIKRLGRTLYTVYEAKRHAERESSVGNETRMYVLDESGLKPVSLEGERWLDDQYEKQSPKDLPFDIEAPDNVLDTFSIVASRPTFSDPAPDRE